MGRICCGKIHRRTLQNQAMRSEISSSKKMLLGQGEYLSPLWVNEGGQGGLVRLDLDGLG